MEGHIADAVPDADRPAWTTAPDPALRAAGVGERTGRVAKARRGACWRRPVPLTLLIAVTISGSFAACERIGTTANASVVERSVNYGGGFLAIGMSEDQPGFVALSALDADEAQVGAEQSTTLLGGTSTTVIVKTPRGTWRRRLRGPVALTIDTDGAVAAAPVAWDLADFATLRACGDCEHGGGYRCGAAFANLAAVLRGWPDDKRCALVRDFLAKHGG